MLKTTVSVWYFFSFFNLLSAAFRRKIILFLQQRVIHSPLIYPYILFDFEFEKSCSTKLKSFQMKANVDDVSLGKRGFRYQFLQSVENENERDAILHNYKIIGFISKLVAFDHAAPFSRDTV